jgi:hypothetical protein
MLSLIFFYKYANACHPEAAATYSVEEATHCIKFESVFSFLHLFMTIHCLYFFYSTLLLNFDVVAGY